MKLNVAYEFHPRQLSVHACEVMDHFGIGFEQGKNLVAENVDLPIAAGDIVAFTGPSGSGKSSLLRAAAAQLDGVVDMHALELPDTILVDGLGRPLAESLELLSACGLSEAQLMLRTPGELSDGQRYRYRLAYAISRGARWILADEFSASLDRILARTVAFNIGRLTAKWNCGFLVASTHEDILRDLQPTLHVRCRLNDAPSLERRERRNERISFAGELTVGTGSKADWEPFARWHYRGKHLGFIRKVLLLRHNDDPVGICVFTAPCRSLKPRNRYFGIGAKWTGLQLRALNAQLVTLSRVVLHPTYRGIGLAPRFVRRCCEQIPFPWIETLTEMGHINPFFEKAGFTRVGQCDAAERSLAEHSAIYAGSSATLGVKQKPHGRQHLLSRATHDKSRHATPVYYIFDNRVAARRERAPSALDGEEEGFSLYVEI
ncbi:MAG: hypothetical protein O2955_20110 [Planctomycetota bacterium]|nr:hypothetical protein [Planctomycetota bacterium]MDA1214818.1 hypothetical protein [Planctomycetota bacterium]